MRHKLVLIGFSRENQFLERKIVAMNSGCGWNDKTLPTKTNENPQIMFFCGMSRRENKNSFKLRAFAQGLKLFVEVCMSGVGNVYSQLHCTCKRNRGQGNRMKIYHLQI